MTYNRNSSITTLTRTGNSQAGYGNMDFLSYSYTGNRLKAITDLGSSNVHDGAFEFVNGANTVVEYYYLRDHLGNDRLVISDTGDIEQTNEYYPYGGPWGDASTFQGLQPFKYNGKELDRVHGLDWYDYGARRYDPAFVQFTQMDPLCEQYPHLSPYAYCAGNPVNAIDPDGMRIWIVEDTKRYRYQDGQIFDNEIVLRDLPAYVQSVTNAFCELNRSKTGKSLISELQNSKNDFVIQNGDENIFMDFHPITAFANNPENKLNISEYIDSSGSGGTIKWNPSITRGGMQENHTSIRPPFIGLGHELFHAQDANRGLLYPNNDYNDKELGIKYKAKYKGLFKSEWRAIYGENLIRRELSLPLRYYYESEAPYGPRLVSKKTVL